MSEDVQVAPCINDHDPERIIVREDGARVCLACRNMYARRNRTRNQPSTPNRETQTNGSRR